MDHKKHQQPIVVLAFILTFLITATSALGATVFDSPTQAANASTRQSWLNAIGVSSPDFLVDFESGFENDQTIGGESGLFPGGLILNSTTGGANRVKIKQRSETGPGSIKRSQPVGEFGVMHTNDLPYFVLDFTLAPVDYVGFQDIDHEGLAGQVIFQSGEIWEFDGIDETENQGDSAEFVGFFNDGGSRIARLNLQSSGDVGWGIDNIEYGAVVPEPRSFVLLSVVFLSGFMRIRPKGDRA